MKRILDVGNCVPDHATLTAYLTKHFECEVLAADGPEETFATLQSQPVDLVLINRKLDRDYTDGADILKALKANPTTAAVPVMLLTNYPDHQAAAVEAGALLGFGKLEYALPETLQKLQAVLGKK